LPEGIEARTLSDEAVEIEVCADLDALRGDNNEFSTIAGPLATSTGDWKNLAEDRVPIQRTTATG